MTVPDRLRLLQCVSINAESLDALPGNSKIKGRSAAPQEDPARSVKSAGKRANQVALGVLTGFCVLVLGGYLLWANQPLVLEAHERVLPEPNGFVLALDAVTRLNPSPDGSPLANRNFTDPKVLREKLAPDERNLDDLRKSLSVEWGIPPVQDSSQKFPYLASFREGARRFAAESRLAAAEGRSGDAIEPALDAVELGSRIGSEASLIHHLVGLSVSAIGVAQADRVAPTLSLLPARSAGERLDRILAQFPTAADAFREERRVTLSTLLRIYRGELDVRAATSDTNGGRPPSGPPWYLFLYPKPQTYHALDRWFGAATIEAEKPYRERRPVPVPGDFLARRLAPFLERSLLATEKNRTALLILRVELALQEYRGRHGDYPQTLAALAPGILPVVPNDPYSGYPLVYRPGREGYRLYSVGPNLKDEGGTPGSEDYTLPNAGGDLVAGQLGYRKRSTKR